ncbi:MAG TPA: hypothetical protein VGA36_08500 [Nitriliruptorales bacterium]
MTNTNQRVDRGPSLEAGVNILPIAPVEAHTVRFDAGVLTFGVEYRHLNEEISRQSLLDNQAAGLTVPDIDPDEVEIDPAEGVSIHVFGTADGGEYLRFDCFDNEPHYHYLDPSIPWTNRLSYDATANGDMLDWVLDRLRTRLPDLLRRTAAGAALADQLDVDLAVKVLDDVEALARRAAQAGSAVA